MLQDHMCTGAGFSRPRLYQLSREDGESCIRIAVLNTREDHTCVINHVVERAARRNIDLRELGF